MTTRDVMNWIRVALSMFILWNVWQNAHWSVALSISFIYFMFEIIGSMLRRMKL